ncbi:unnamed protein product [Protopolystoma xenopodis]|uniref:Uncharacterized protein n=1 Tax=Protopolystoma xenopodis TaxID=117903 RepID=A0A3S5CJ61_9PLAT|nr:unnamed protein product [Protopolystoma xenopodis]
MNGHFLFVPPPEAPVFRPNEEEFKDPLDYIAKIRPIAFKTGICKIVPPKTWNPPFAVDINEFRFKPRIQRLYELEGGDKLRVPSIAGKYLDIFKLYKLVTENGGYQSVSDLRIWPTIAEKLGYQATRHASVIKQNYERILLGFDVVVNANGGNDEDVQEINYSANNELKNLRFFGAGPKATVPIIGGNTDRNCSTNLEEFSCRVCGSGDDEADLLICDTDSCQACYHLYCLTPPLTSVPKCRWKCPDCVRRACTLPNELYGFPQSQKTYTLYEFGVQADQFKAKYFGTEPCSMTYSAVESEFWRILQEYNEDVVVEYGADIHSSDVGSGFPTWGRIKTLVGTAEQLEEAKRYAASPWNLNNIAVLDR